MERQRSFRSLRRRHNLPKPPLAERAKDHCRQFTAFMFSNVGIIILVVVYMTSGKLEPVSELSFFSLVKQYIFQSNEHSEEVGVSYSNTNIIMCIRSGTDCTSVFSSHLDLRIKKKLLPKQFANKP